MQKSKDLRVRKGQDGLEGESRGFKNPPSLPLLSLATSCYPLNVDSNISF